MGRLANSDHLRCFAWGAIVSLAIFSGCQKSTGLTCDLSGPPANAGCLIVVRENVLWMQQKSGLWALPGGTNESGESAQCTARRETMEETGLRVEVGPLLREYPNGFHLYRCRPQVVPESNVLPALQPQDTMEVHTVAWVPVGQIMTLPMRFPEYLPLTISDIAKVISEGTSAAPETAAPETVSLVAVTSEAVSSGAVSPGAVSGPVPLRPDTR